MTWEYVNEDRIKKIIKHITGKMTADDGELLPSVIIKGKGSMWCYSPIKKTVIKVVRGTMGYIIDETQDSKGRILMYTKSAHIIAIEIEEIEEMGFN